MHRGSLSRVTRTVSVDRWFAFGSVSHSSLNEYEDRQLLYQYESWNSMGSPAASKYLENMIQLVTDDLSTVRLETEENTPVC